MVSSSRMAQLRSEIRDYNPSVLATKGVLAIKQIIKRVSGPDHGDD